LNFFVSKIGNAVEVTHELTANTAAFLISSDGVMPFTSSDFDADDDDADATNKTPPLFPPLNPPLEDVKTTSSRQRVFSFLFFQSLILLRLLLLFILLLLFLFLLLYDDDDDDATVVENIIFNIVLLLLRKKKKKKKKKKNSQRERKRKGLSNALSSKAIPIPISRLNRPPNDRLCA
jgi:hypothetical protein